MISKMLILNTASKSSMVIRSKVMTTLVAKFKRYGRFSKPISAKSNDDYKITLTG